MSGGEETGRKFSDGVGREDGYLVSSSAALGELHSRVTFLCRAQQAYLRRNGDGRSFPRNPRSQEMLSRLAERLEKEA